QFLNTQWLDHGGCEQGEKDQLQQHDQHQRRSVVLPAGLRCRRSMANLPASRGSLPTHVPQRPFRTARRGLMLRDMARSIKLDPRGYYAAWSFAPYAGWGKVSPWR